MRSGALELDSIGSAIISIVIGIVLIAAIAAMLGAADPLSFANSGILQGNLQELQ